MTSCNTSIFVILLCLYGSSVQAANWALLIAGSNGWDNYRHQADVCHAYQVMIKHGIAENNIVTLMYDDLANNQLNPTPGIVINQPNGTNNYGGVKIDYRTEDVTPTNFLKILRGDADAMSGIGSGRVINSGPNDHVFVNFVDHGAPGLLGFPNGDILHASDLIDTLLNMAKNNQFKQMVIYVEACESGSVFKNLLPSNINIYATTAANPDESSYACFYDAKRRTYLGDVYSVDWMMDSDTEDLTKESLKTQFEILLKVVNTSHPQEYGDMTIANEPVAEFQGNEQKVHRSMNKKYFLPSDAVPSEDVPLAILRHRLTENNDVMTETQLQSQIRQLIMQRTLIDTTMAQIVQLASKHLTGVDQAKFTKQHLQLTNLKCYYNLVGLLRQKCISFKHDYVLRRLYMLVNLCEIGIPVDTTAKAINIICPIPVL